MPTMLVMYVISITLMSIMPKPNIIRKKQLLYFDNDKHRVDIKSENVCSFVRLVDIILEKLFK